MFCVASQDDELVALINFIVLRSMNRRQTLKISLVLFGTNCSFKCQNTLSLKTGVLIKVSEMRRLH